MIQAIDNQLEIEPIVEDHVDLSERFITDKIFESRQELIDWAKETGKEVGTVIVTKRSDFVTGRRPRLLLGCERAGKYRAPKPRAEKKGERKKVGTKLCGCPFLLRGLFQVGSQDKWKVKVDCGRHNHPLVRFFEGKSSVGKLTAEERKIVEEMSASGLKLKQALTVIKSRNPTNASTIRTHSRLKKQLGTSNYDILGMWRIMHPLMNLQFAAIKASFETSMKEIQHRHQINVLKDVRGVISIAAMDIILEEKKRGGNIELDAVACGCALRRTHGLPCAHELVMYVKEGSFIPLSSIHPIWKKLSALPDEQKRVDLESHPEFHIFIKHFNESCDDRKVYLLERLKELADPETTLERLKELANPQTTLVIPKDRS
ncbi:hypothetical protein BVC80_9069g45 [Macleaya cordata]|uniref:Protein FAR1-RELATED SEQUENCE n=1 Tax=Macleaya cordata TaxID=56857 RepID=A0A200PP00_MACCD|nr:hypothetical protein BVC80_9069g45 [Macleaya cordata]